jgi:hypothetical protein
MKRTEIDLTKLVNPYIDLKDYADKVELKGAYIGPAVVFKNSVQKQQLICDEAAIISTEGFAIKTLNCFEFNLTAGKLQLTGGVQIIGDLPFLLLDGVHVRKGDVGLHMTQHNGTEKYGTIIIKNSSFCDCDNEGGYIGKYAKDEPEKGIIYPKSNFIYIENCDFLRNGYDGFQPAHTKQLKATNCVFAKNGTRGVEWHGKTLILNPGIERADIVNCVIDGKQQFYGVEKLFIS